MYVGIASHLTRCVCGRVLCGRASITSTHLAGWLVAARGFLVACNNPHCVPAVQLVKSEAHSTSLAHEWRRSVHMASDAFANTLACTYTICAAGMR
jgi:hypothetical protein